MSAINTVRRGLAPVALAVAVACALGACKKEPTAADGAVATATQQTPAPTAESVVSASVNAMSADQLRSEASKAYDENRLYAPAGNNAMEYYLALRDKAPADAGASSALTDLMPMTVIAAEQAIAREDFDESKRLSALIEKAAEADGGTGSQAPGRTGQETRRGPAQAAGAATPANRRTGSDRPVQCCRTSGGSGRSAAPTGSGGGSRTPAGCRCGRRTTTPAGGRQHAGSRTTGTCCVERIACDYPIGAALSGGCPASGCGRLSAGGVHRGHRWHRERCTGGVGRHATPVPARFREGSHVGSETLALPAHQPSHHQPPDDQFPAIRSGSTCMKKPGTRRAFSWLAQTFRPRSPASPDDNARRPATTARLPGRARQSGRLPIARRWGFHRG